MSQTKYFSSVRQDIIDEPVSKCTLVSKKFFICPLNPKLGDWKENSATFPVEMVLEDRVVDKCPDTLQQI